MTSERWMSPMAPVLSCSRAASRSSSLTAVDSLCTAACSSHSIHTTHCGKATDTRCTKRIWHQFREVSQNLYSSVAMATATLPAQASWPSEVTPGATSSRSTDSGGRVAMHKHPQALWEFTQGHNENEAYTDAAACHAWHCCGAVARFHGQFPCLSSFRPA